MLVAAALVLASAPARACPRAATCAVLAREPARMAAPAQPLLRLEPLAAWPGVRPAVRLRLPRAPSSTAVARHGALARSLRDFVPPRHADDEPEMPWMWQVLRHQVSRRMPHYAKRHLDVTASPMVITGTFDTVPGVGAGGVF